MHQVETHDKVAAFIGRTISVRGKVVDVFFEKELPPINGLLYNSFYPVKRMYAYMEKGKIDIAVFSYKKSRESFLVYGKEPLFTSGYRPIV